MRLLMTALGSYGDVLPIVGLGAAMHARGHQVTIITSPHFQKIVESAGVDFLPIGTAQEYDDLAHHKDLWHPIRGPLLVIRMAMVGALRELYELIASQYRPGETVLVAHSLDLASRVFREKHGAPLACIQLAPVVLRSFHESPKMHGMWMADWLPRWFRKAQYWMADRLVVDRLLGPEVNGFRKELGLEPEKSVLSRWYFSEQLVLGMFPDWFAAPQPDWPARTALTGFPLWDQSSIDGLPEEVDEFVRGGEPPIVFAPGSAMTRGESFFAAAVEACRRLGRRGILMTQYPDQLPKNLPEDVRHFGFVPFSRLLPRAAALVHHGGIGTSAQGLAAGLPQLVMPMAYDQPDNAVRLRRLGVAAVIKPRQFRGPAVAMALDELLASNSTHENCHRYARECDGNAALAASCDLLEGLAEDQ